MLHLAVGLAVFIGFIWAFVVFPSFRVVTLILIALGVGGYFVLSEKAELENKQLEAAKAQEEQQRKIKFEAEQKDYCQAEQKRWTIVPASQIEIRDPSLTQKQYSLGNDEYTFTASAKNKSKSRVTGLRVNVTALDCPIQDARATACDVVGRNDGTFDADIPAGEVRQINGKVTLRDVPKPRGGFSPRFVVSAVRASLDESEDTKVDHLFGHFMGYRCQ